MIIIPQAYTPLQLHLSYANLVLELALTRVCW